MSISSIIRCITRPVAKPAISRSIAFDPIFLFGSGEQGWYFDNSDLSSMWQDAAQTTPVTAAGQPVGYQLDKSGNGNHRSQPTAGSRPILRLNATAGAYYLETDGVDDWMSTASIDFTGTDKISLFAGVRKLSDAAVGMVAELGTAGAGRFSVNAPRNAGSANYGVDLRDGVNVATKTTSSVYPSPNSAVLTTIMDFAAATVASQVDLRINSSAAAISSGTMAVGNYGNHPAYFFRRGGTSLPFNGHEYANICAGRLATPAEIAATEQFLAARVGVTLP